MIENKTCQRCNKNKPISEFNINKLEKDGFNFRCRHCDSLVFKKHYQQNSQKIKLKNATWRKQNITLLKEIRQESNKKRYAKMKQLKQKILEQQSCIICQEKRLPCLEFHHIDATQKIDSVSSFNSPGQFLREVAKCTILCANCHALFHAGYIKLTNIQPIDISKYQT